MDGLGSNENQTTPRASDQLGPDKSGDKEPWSLDSRVTEWTDEKHSLYLKSMEASFVNQLYSAADIPARSDVTSSRKMHCATSGQFKILRRGCWQKLYLERPEFQPNRTCNSHGLSANPWIRHFKSECKPKTFASPYPPEVSDQNFIDEESKGEKASCTCSSKKMKTEKPDASSHDDQVVPRQQSKRTMTENCPEKCVFPAR
ncbi:Cold-regulated protein 27 [Citrus sinensis]|uniref:Uncharacterized protein n=1 Tax=Citrus clementina TaxID=85681 RepID=V4T487_CITCL|nr:uncharacterized protein LOC18041209 isoform X3 [Citrus x clementina]XP_006473322.2 cold-regulated protein 27 isoform X4 [Citrus sinensis]ESR48002.1 hypothetical protein CICLE_v10002531mg [Citrus x clementina]KAH9692478.1 Cold-regulated protein 27 [Citrus sinensis]